MNQVDHVRVKSDLLTLRSKIFINLHRMNEQTNLYTGDTGELMGGRNQRVGLEVEQSE